MLHTSHKNITNWLKFWLFYSHCVLFHCRHVLQSTLYFSIVDMCYNSPCTNGGTCSSDYHSYLCDCPSGFDGINCETGNHLNYCSWYSQSLSLWCIVTKHPNLFQINIYQSPWRCCPGFGSLKQSLINETLLHYVQSKRDFILDVDASQYVIGACLQQLFY